MYAAGSPRATRSRGRRTPRSAARCLARSSLLTALAMIGHPYYTTDDILALSAVFSNPTRARTQGCLKVRFRPGTGVPEHRGATGSLLPVRLSKRVEAHWRTSRQWHPGSAKPRTGPFRPTLSQPWARTRFHRPGGGRCSVLPLIELSQPERKNASPLQRVSSPGAWWAPRVALKPAGAVLGTLKSLISIFEQHNLEYGRCS